MDELMKMCKQRDKKLTVGYKSLLPVKIGMRICRLVSKFVDVLVQEEQINGMKIEQVQGVKQQS